MHSILHLCFALVGGYAAWDASNIELAKRFTSGIGLLYFALSMYGWFTPGLFLGTRLVIPLQAADNVFHLILSVPTLVIIVLDGRVARQAVTAPGASR